MDEVPPAGVTDGPGEPGGPDTAVARWRRRATAAIATGQALLDDLRQRFGPVDVAMRIHERDKEAAGTLLGSALALRLFLFFVPLVLTSVGIAGVLGRLGVVDAVGATAGISGSIAQEIDAAFDQRTTAPWIAVVVGLFGMGTTGRSLARALVLSSALSSELGGRQKLRVRAIGVVVGLAVGMALTTSILNRVRLAAGIAVASVSYVAVVGIYLLLWMPMFGALPRRTSDPGAALPGAAIMAAVMTGLQMVLALYLPHQIEGASTLYGTIGVVVAVLGWFFVIGRAIALSFAVNAVLYEEVGSVSGFVFGLPGLRAISRRVPAVRRFFDLDGRRGDGPLPEG